jgi:aconitate hydratase
VALDKLGFTLAGYGCMTRIRHNGDLANEVSEAITNNDLVVSSIQSGIGNFEDRVNRLNRAKYLGSLALVIAYALAGTVNLDSKTESIGKDEDG